MATSSVQVTEGVGKRLATHSISEDAQTKEIQRIALADSAGVAVAPLTDTELRATPVPVSATDLDIRNLTNVDVVTAELSTADKALIGALTETAPASDTASSGLSGRLQRIAQRITSLIALLPTALGAGGGLKVDGSGTALPVTSSVTSIAAGENHLGEIGSRTKTVLVTPTVSASPDYGIDDVLGGKITIPAIFRANDKTGTINMVMVTCDAGIPAGVTIDVVFFNADPSNSTFTDNGGIAVNVADLHFIAGVAQLDKRITLGTPTALVETYPKGIPIQPVSGTDDLYAVMIVRGAATLNLGGTSDINLIVGMFQD